MKQPGSAQPVLRYADMFSAMGTEHRLHILRLLISAHPVGKVVGDIQDELEIPASTLSHHLEKLKNEGLVTVRRDRQFLWYAANTDALQELVAFLYEECCCRSKPMQPAAIARGRRPRLRMRTQAVRKVGKNERAGYQENRARKIR